MKIGLLGMNYPSDNLGVSALSCCQIKLLDELGDELDLTIEYFVVGMSAIEDNDFSTITKWPVNYRQLRIRCSIHNIYNISLIYKQLKECDILIDISAGDSFTDIYGIKRYLYQFISKILCLLARKTIVFAPQTIGPFNMRITKALSTYIMNKVRHLYARDILSYNYLNGLKLKYKPEMMTDIAFLLPYYSNNYDLDVRFTNVGLNVSGLLYNGGYNGTNQFGLNIDYKAFVEELIQYFIALNNVRLYLVPHVISNMYLIEDDYRVCESLSKKYNKCKLSPRFNTPVEAKCFISSLDFFVGSRMHATIAAFSSGVPVVPVSYSKKFIGLFTTLNYECIVDGNICTNSQAVNIVTKAFKDRLKLKERIRSANAIAFNSLKTYRSHLRDEMSSK